MLRHTAKAIGAALTLALPLTAGAHTAQQGGLQVVHPWVAPSEAGTTAIAHPTITNTGERAVVLTGAHAAVAESVRMIIDDARVTEITLKPGQTLAPEHFRLELRHLKTRLPKGKAVPVEFRLRDKAPMTFHVVVGRDTMKADSVVKAPRDQSRHDD